jgi:hypothetical protein
MESDTAPTTLRNGDASASLPYPEPKVQGPYKVLEQYHSQPNSLRVIGVGAGATGTKKGNFFFDFLFFLVQATYFSEERIMSCL